MGIHEEAEDILEDKHKEDIQGLVEAEEERDKAWKQREIFLNKKEALERVHRKAVKLGQWEEAHDLLYDIYRAHLAMINAYDAFVAAREEIEELKR